MIVAGQYGSSTDGAVVSTDFTEQVQQAFHNLGVALAAHGLDLSHVVQLRTYVVNPDFDKLGAIAQAVQGGCGANPPTQTGRSSRRVGDLRVLRMVTIGVYGFDGESFLQRLREANVRLLDVRQRRGVRGPEYAWANSRRLQAALTHARIAYEHHPELAPTTELRQLQYA